MAQQIGFAAEASTSGRGGGELQNRLTHALVGKNLEVRPSVDETGRWMGQRFAAAMTAAARVGSTGFVAIPSTFVSEPTIAPSTIARMSRIVAALAPDPT